MEKKGELKNCKIFSEKGRFLKDLPTDAIIPITIIGENQSGDTIDREGVYFSENGIFQTRVSDGRSFKTEEYKVISLADTKSLKNELMIVRKIFFYSAISDEIEEGFLNWPRLIFYITKNPEEGEKTITITGKSGSEILKFNVKLNDINEEGFMYRKHEFFRIS